MSILKLLKALIFLFLLCGLAFTCARAQAPAPKADDPLMKIYR